MSSFLPTYDDNKVERVLDAICQDLEAKGLIPQGQGHLIKEQMMQQFKDLSIEPREILEPSSKIRQNLSSLATMKGKGLDISNLLTLMQQGPEADPQAIKNEYKRLFEQAIELEPNPQKKLLLKGAQKAFDREFDRQLQNQPEDALTNTCELFMKMTLTMDRVKPEPSLEEKQQAEAIRGVTLGQDPRAGAGDTVVLQMQPGNSMGLEELGDLVGQFVSARQTNSKVDSSQVDATGTQQMVEDRAVAIDPIITPVLEKLENVIDEAKIEANARVSSEMGPRPGGPSF